MHYKCLLPFLDQNGNTSTDEELENNSLKSLSTSPARTESINASHSFGNGSVNSYTCSRIYTGRDAKENYQFGMIRNSLNLVNDHSISAIPDLLKSFYS